MRFYGRRNEIEKIRSYYRLVKSGNSKMLVITGRRRIGKTRLALESVKNIPYLYFFVRKKRIRELLSDWSEEIRRVFGNVFYGEFRSIEDFLNFLFDFSLKNSMVAIFDEFQNFFYSNPGEFSLFQKVFDLKKQDSKLLLIFCGSSYSLMEKIFKNAKEPLFGRASECIKLSYMTLSDQKEFLNDQGLFSGKDQLMLYSIFDGVPKYLEELAEFSDRSIKTRLQKIFRNQDWIWEEGENILKEEFGKSYVSYFSVLSAIAKGRRILGEIEQFSGINDAGAYLKNLEKVSGNCLIDRRLPVTSKSPKEKKGRYYLRDNFFNFWFKFIDNRRNLKEIGQVEKAVEEMFSDLDSFLGRKLEDMFIRRFIEENPFNIEFNRIGKYWNRKGDIDIDAMVINDNKREVYAFEVKLNPKKITQKVMNNLFEKVSVIPELRGFTIKTGKVYILDKGLQIEIS